MLSHARHALFTRLNSTWVDRWLVRMPRSKERRTTLHRKNTARICRCPGRRYSYREPTRQLTTLPPPKPERTESLHHGREILRLKLPATHRGPEGSVRPHVPSTGPLTGLTKGTEHHMQTTFTTPHRSTDCTRKPSVHPERRWERDSQHWAASASKSPLKTVIFH